MLLKEVFVKGKRDDARLCEDGWALTPHFAAVVDGSTSKVAGRSGGRMAMELVCEALHALQPDACKADMLRCLTQVLSRHNPPEAAHDAAWRLTCSAAVYSRHRRVVWLVGDCQCRMAGVTHTHPKRVDAVLTQVRCDALRYLLAHGLTADEVRRRDPGRAFIHDLLREQTNFQNDPNPLNPFRYPVLDGLAPDPALVPELPVPAGSDLVLASDGYPVVCDTLADTEAELRRLLRTDPLCVGENAATKCLMAGNVSFDDRCYLRIGC